MSRLIFGKSRWPHRGIKGGGCPHPYSSTTSDFGEIWAIYVNLLKKNNEIYQNSLDVYVRGAGGAPASVKNSNTSNFGEIWTVFVNLPKKNV